MGGQAIQGPAAADLLAFLLVTTRVAAWIVVCPPLNTRSVPATVKALLSCALGLLMFPQARAHVPGLGTAEVVTALAVQIAVGLSLGFCTLVLFSAVQSAGNLVDLFGGFSLSTAFDPLSANGNSVFGRLHQWVAVVLLLVTGAYGIVLAGLARSFEVVPLDGSMAVDGGGTLVDALGAMFLATAQVAAPLVAVMFLADVGLGLMTKIAPALNAFSLGFPLKIMLMLLLVGLTFPLLPQTVKELAEHGVVAGLTLVGG